MSALLVSGDSLLAVTTSGSGVAKCEIFLRAVARDSHCSRGRRPTISPIPKLGMAIHNNNRPNADNPAGLARLRGTMVIEAKSHSLSRNLGKTESAFCDGSVSETAPSVKEG